MIDTGTLSDLCMGKAVGAPGLRTGSVEHLLSGGGCPSGFELCFPKCGNLILRFFIRLGVLKGLVLSFECEAA